MIYSFKKADSLDYRLGFMSNNSTTLGQGSGGPNGRMLKLFLSIFVCFVLAGCVANKKEPVIESFRYVEGANLITYESGRRVNNVASSALVRSKSAGVPANPTDYAYFRDAHTGRDWLSERIFRAVAVGVPDACSVRYRTWGYSSLWVAVRAALSKCLVQVKHLASHTGAKCGCRVAAMDNTIFVTPDEFPNRHQLPSLLSVSSEKGSAKREEVLGVLDLNNLENRFEFKNLKGVTVCSGRVDRDRGGLSGTMEGQCFKGGLKGSGRYRVTGYVHGNLSGIAELTLGTSRARMIFGLSDTDFAKKRAEFDE